MESVSAAGDVGASEREDMALGFPADAEATVGLLRGSEMAAARYEEVSKSD